MRIQWSPPINNGGSAVTQYKITIADHANLLIENLAYCDGSNTIIKNNLYCEIPMSILRSSPYNLVYGDLVQAKVSARNLIGWNTESTSNTIGATI